MALWRLLQRLTGRQRTLEDAHADAVLDELAALRTDVLAAIASQPSEWRVYQLEQLLALIDDLVTERSTAAGGVVRRYLPQALALGTEQAVIGVSVARLAGLGLLDLSPTLMEAVVTATQTQVQDVWTELGADLRNTVRRVALGVQRPDEALPALIPAVRDAKSFGTAAVRADVIVRTETNRAFSLAAAARLDELHALFGDAVRKRWVSFTDERTRKTHRAANARYGFDGTPIPVTDRFAVGSAQLRYPLDPEGPPAEVIQCRCKLVPVLMEEQ